MTDSPYYTTEEAARILRRQPYTIRRRCATGRYPGARKDGGEWLIPRELVRAPEPQGEPESEIAREARRFLADCR